MVVLGEGHLDGHFRVGLGADQLLFEAGYELARAQHQLGVGGCAAVEGDAIDGPDKVDHQHVAVLGLHRLALAGFIGAVLLGQVGQGFVDLGVARGIDGLFQLQRGRVHRGEVGHDLDGQLVVQVRQAGDDLLHIGLGLQVGLGGGAQVVVRQHLLAGFAEGLFDHLDHQRLAVQAAHMGQRHLARAKALDPHLRRELLDSRFEL